MVFRDSSEMARRGKCKLCGTFLVLDYEWFEPHTVCLVRPLWREVRLLEAGEHQQRLHLMF